MISLLEQLKTLCEQTIILMLALISLYTPTFGGINDTLTQEQQILKSIETAQNSYYQSHGRYFQGLPTSKEIPITEIEPDNLNIKPYYQTEKWSDFILLPAKLPFQIEIHQYKAPNGAGYQIFIRDENSVRAYGYGSEAESRTYEHIK